MKSKVSQPKFLAEIPVEKFPVTFKLKKIAITLPVASCGPERCFSVMKVLKLRLQILKSTQKWWSMNLHWAIVTANWILSYNFCTMRCITTIMIERCWWWWKCQIKPILFLNKTFTFSSFYFYVQVWNFQCVLCSYFLLHTAIHISLWWLVNYVIRVFYASVSLGLCQVTVSKCDEYALVNENDACIIWIGISTCEIITRLIQQFIALFKLNIWSIEW